MSETDWQPIETAPKDGTVILLSWFDGGEPAEIFPMQWGHIQRNGLFPAKVGMWVVPDGSMTWNDDRGGGPTHWMPLYPPPQEDGTMSNTSIIWPALDAKRFAVLLRTGPLTYRLDRIAERLNK